MSPKYSITHLWAFAISKFPPGVILLNPTRDRRRYTIGHSLHILWETSLDNCPLGIFRRTNRRKSPSKLPLQTFFHLDIPRTFLSGHPPENSPEQLRRWQLSVTAHGLFVAVSGPLETVLCSKRPADVYIQCVVYLTGAALPDNNEASAKLTTQYGRR